MSSTLKTELILSDSNFNAKLSAATRKAQASLNQIQQSTRGLNGVLGLLGGLIGGLTSLLSGLLNSSKLLANPWVAAGAAIAGAGVAFFNYNKNLEQTLNRTQQFTGLTGNSLNSLRNGIAATARTFGKEFNDVLSGVDNLMNQFSISGETALLIIKDGFVAGANDSGLFLENLSKYSGAFNDIGISADELTALLAQTRSGIFSQEGMDAILMAGKNIRTMSKSAKESLAAIGISGDDMVRKLNSGLMTTMDAIRQISGALKELPALSKVVGDVLQDVFGKKGSLAGHELISALSEVSTNLDEVKEQTGEDGKVMDELADTTREFMNACQSLFGVTDSGFSHLTDLLKISVMQALTKVINRFIDLYNKSMLVRGGIAAIATVFKSMWAVVKGILKGFVDTLEGVAGMLEGLITADWDMMKNSAKKAWNGLQQDARQAGKEIGKAITGGINQTLNGHIDKVTTVEYDKEEYGKSGGKGGSTTLKGKPDSSKSGNKSNKDKKDKFAKGSLTDLEKQLKDLQDKYKGGLLKITPEDYQKQVNDLEAKIRQKKIELGIEFKYSADTIEGIEERIKKLQENQSSSDVKLHLDTKEYNKKLAELTKQLLDKKISIITELDENSLSILELKLKNLEDNQISENVYLHIDGEEYKKQHKELKQQIESEKIKLGVSLTLDDTDKQFTELMNDYRKKSSFEMAVGPDKINKQDYETLLQIIQLLMDENDQLLELLKELQKEYKKLGQAGQYGYSMIESQIANVTAEQLKLSESATKTNELSKSLKNLIKNFNGGADAVGKFGNALSSLGSMNKNDPTLNILGTVTQAIANIVMGASQAIALAGTLGGPWAWIGFGATVMAEAAALIAQIHSLTGFKDGGIIGGGHYIGDKQIIRANSGEMIINEGLLSRLFRLLNGEASMQMQPALAGGQVEFHIRGQELVGVISNYNKKKSKI